MSQDLDKTVWRIIDRETNKSIGSYNRGYHDVYEFESAYKARLDNCHGMFTDEEKYKISKYKVTYELIDDDCEIEEEKKKYYEADKERQGYN